MFSCYLRQPQTVSGLGSCFCTARSRVEGLGFCSVLGGKTARHAHKTLNLLGLVGNKGM